MDFLLSDVHDDLASTVDALLTKADIPARARAWTHGDHHPVAEVVTALAETGITGLLIDESSGGSSAGATEMVVAMEQVGRHALPGPIVETVAVLPVLLRSAGVSGSHLSALVEGALATCAIPPIAPLAPIAETSYVVIDGVLSTATTTDRVATVDPTRILAELGPDEVLAENVDVHDAADIGTLATAAQLLGMASAMLASAADYAQARKQFGRAIGSFQSRSRWPARSSMPPPWASTVWCPKAPMSAGMWQRRRSLPVTPPISHRDAHCRCSARSGTPPSTICRCISPRRGPC